MNSAASTQPATLYVAARTGTWHTSRTCSLPRHCQAYNLECPAGTVIPAGAKVCRRCDAFIVIVRAREAALKDQAI